MYKYEDLLNRDFHADSPNQKWVTDISYIHTDEGVIYLSMIRDIYNNSIVAYKTAVQQTVSLILDTIRLAMKDEKRGPLRRCTSRSCTSTAAKGSSTLHRGTST